MSSRSSNLSPLLPYSPLKPLHRAILVNVIPHDVDRNEAERDFDELVRLVQSFERLRAITDEYGRDHAFIISAHRRNNLHAVKEQVYSMLNLV